MHLSKDLYLSGEFSANHNKDLFRCEHIRLSHRPITVGFFSSLHLKPIRLIVTKHSTGIIPQEEMMPVECLVILSR